MQKLNYTHRGFNRPTDVLAFSSHPFPSSRHQGQAMLSEWKTSLGDVVICPAYARLEAARRKIALREELIRLLAHGTLHLLGFDHATKKQERRMFALQERCVSQLKTI